MFDRELKRNVRPFDELAGNEADKLLASALLASAIVKTRVTNEKADKKLRRDVALQFACAMISSGKFNASESKAEFIHAHKMAEEFIVAGDK